VETQNNHDEKQVNSMIKKQVAALFVFLACALVGGIAMALNLKSIMSSDNPMLIVALCQIPLGASGIYLGMVLMQAGRKEKLRSED
jgi:cytochrome bd-type quinol oxidase subunit 1